mmetsp:Transcript_35285/g.46455  ORF Transcript_35285/g.46455 Transcript_35285/m.46455 type:complete len:90 (+) Transcript_35285:118-387(+)
MRRESITVALIACLAHQASALWAYEDQDSADLADDSIEDFFSMPMSGSEDDGSLEGLGIDGGEALYYDPQEQVIYEITTGDEEDNKDAI